MLHVLDDKVAIIPVRDPDKYGHIIIPDSVREDKRPDQGVVYAIGPNVRDVTVGDHVLFSPYSGHKVSVVDIGVLHIMPEEAVIAWLDDDEREQLFPLSEVKRLVRHAWAQHQVLYGETQNDLFFRLIDRILEEFDSYTLSRGLEY